ncbi:MAG TPA: hypothetical protein VIT88_05310 [Pyrinomonadaceae bacterium]
MNLRRRVNSDVGLLFVMNSQTESIAHGWSRPTWVVLAILSALLLLVQLMRSTRVSDRWISLVVAATFLINALTHIFRLKGRAKLFSQVICWVIVVIAGVMLMFSIFMSGF